MGVLRNREFLRWLLFGALAGALGTLLCAHFSPQAAWVTAGTVVVMLAIFSAFTIWRYHRLAALCTILKRVNSGDYTLEVADSDEGELSILQSELYKTILTLREQSEHLKKEKEQLVSSLSDISHQLKTPLTSMFVMTELLYDGSLSDEQRKVFTARLRAQLERLQWLVESLLKLSKLDAGTVEFGTRETQPDQLLDKSLAPLRIPAELKCLNLRAESDGRAIFCDPNWTVEALVNLLKNCVEHTPTGGEVYIRAETNPLYTQITVRDTGPGFAAADLPHLFKRFYRGRDAGEGGVGIGLAMARSITQSQGGTLTAQNAQDGGALFTLRLPRTATGV
jgi:signal transduction histidine kinase